MPTTATAARHEAFGAAIREARRRANLSQAELGRRLARRVTQGAIQQWERGLVEPPSAEVFNLEQALGLYPGELAGHLGYGPPGSVVAAITNDAFLSNLTRPMVLAAYQAAREFEQGRQRPSPRRASGSSRVS